MNIQKETWNSYRSLFQRLEAFALPYPMKQTTRKSPRRLLYPHGVSASHYILLSQIAIRYSAVRYTTGYEIITPRHLPLHCFDRIRKVAKFRNVKTKRKVNAFLYFNIIIIDGIDFHQHNIACKGKIFFLIQQIFFIVF